MQRMWSPWRSQYIASFKGEKKKGRNSVSLFTAAWRSRDDLRHLIVWRGTTCFVLMNRYPYNSGHLMVVPYRQVADFQDLTLVELADLMQAVQRSMRALDEVMKPQGYNLGANLGRAAGAGIDNHIHFHIVPRWNGDTNFMPTLGDTKVISEEVRRTLRRLRKSMKNKEL